MNTDLSTVPTRYWTRLDDGRVQCDVCPRHCRLHEGQRGLCFVRGRERDGIELYTYGRSSGFCVDPIEKKPLNHFLPGTSGAVVRHGGLQPGLQVLPELGHEQVARDGHARRLGLPGGARGDGAAARLRQRRVHLQRSDHLPGVRDRRRGRPATKRACSTVAVTAGYICPEPRAEFFASMDAANVDLKAFTERFYRKICGGRLAAGARHARVPEARDDASGSRSPRC